MSNNLLEGLKSKDSTTIHQTLTLLASQTKHLRIVSELETGDAFEKIWRLLDKNEGRYNAVILSILGNCCNFNHSWRNQLMMQDGAKRIESILEKCSDNSVLSRAARLMANLAKDDIFLSSFQTKQTLDALMKYACSDNIKCQKSFLRALRIIGSNSKSAKILAENNLFPKLLKLLESADNEVFMLCLRMICELLKTQAVEMCYRLIESNTLNKILQLHNTGNEQVKELCLQILFLLSLNSGCRVTVAMEGAIEIFLSKIKCLKHSESFKYATQGLCLCAREAVSRNKMKSDGVLPALVNILHEDELVSFHESIVAAFVWFIFDDSSLGLLIRADVIPALLKYLNRLTYVEYNRSGQIFENETASVDERTEQVDQAKEVVASPFKPTLDTSNYLTNEQWVLSSPETSPYNANSPQYSIPSFSPHMSPDHSIPSPSYASVDYDTYSESCFESSSNGRFVPYHFQSADGIHAMIHGTRGPIHDILLLLSRFSQANDPSSFFLSLPDFNSLINYLLLSFKPNPKCARVLNRITLNSHCFDVMIRKRLVPRLYLRLCCGYSLEYLTEQFEKAKANKFQEKGFICSAAQLAINQTSECNTNNKSTDIEKIDIELTNYEIPDESSLHSRNERDISLLWKTPSTTTFSLGQLLLSNIRSHSESSYGKGVLSHILLTGSRELRETCMFSLPHIVWSKRLQKRMFKDLKSMDLLLEMLSNCLLMESESFILTVEASCALSRLLLVDSESPTFDVEFPEFGPPLAKRPKLTCDERYETSQNKRVCFKLPSGKILTCSSSKLCLHSAVFERMLSRDYVDADQPYVSFADVHEDAFVKMIHYMHGCIVQFNSDMCKDCQMESVISQTESFSNQMESVSSDESNSCLNANNVILETPVKCHPAVVSTPTESLKRRWASSPTPPFRDQNMGCDNLVRELLICCERFFVDSLKYRCEIYLINTLSKDTVVECVLLSFMNRASVLLRHSLIYLLTDVKCPLVRVTCFAELLHSHERDAFLSEVTVMLREGYERSQLMAA